MNNLVLLVVLPLLGAFITPSIGRLSGFLAKITGPAIMIFLIGLSTSSWKVIDSSHPVALNIAGFKPPFGITFYIDQLAILFSILIAITFILVWPWHKKIVQESTENKEYSLYLLLAAASFGLVLSGDLFNLYVFYELLAVASYGLIAKPSLVNKSINSAKVAASLRYLFISSAGSVVLLLGIALIYTQTGTLNIAQLSLLAPEKLHNYLGYSAFILILVGVGVKAEMFPVNSWVPEVYGVISKPLSALMAGLISKLAVLFIVRILLMIFQQTDVLNILLIVGILGVITGELVAWRAKDMIRMLSFSSIAQLGLIFIAFSIPGSTGLFIGLALMLHHLVVKMGLFFLAERLDGSIDNLKGMLKSSPLTVIIFLLFILSLLGVPPLPGFWVKFSLIINLAFINYGYMAIGFILLATIIEAAYLFRLVQTLFSNTENQSEQQPKPLPTVETKLYFFYAQGFATILIISTFMLSPIESGLNKIASQAADAQTYIQTVNPMHSHLNKQNSEPQSNQQHKLKTPHSNSSQPLALNKSMAITGEQKAVHTLQKGVTK